MRGQRVGSVAARDVDESALLFEFNGDWPAFFQGYEGGGPLRKKNGLFTFGRLHDESGMVIRCIGERARQKPTRWGREAFTIEVDRHVLFLDPHRHLLSDL